MIFNSYKFFSNELTKQATVLTSVGKGIGRILDVAWKHPKTTLAIGITGASIPILAKKILPTFLIGEELRKHHVMNEQTQLMKSILNESKKTNEKPIVAKPINIPIERPLV